MGMSEAAGREVEAGDSVMKRPKPEEAVAVDVAAKHRPKPETGGDETKILDPESAAVRGKSKILDLEEEEAAAGHSKTKIFDPEEEAAATKKRPVFLRQCQLLKAGKKFKKVMVPVNPEVAEAMLDWPRQDMSKFDELPEGFDDLPEVFRAAILRGRDLAKKLVKEEEDILEQFRTQGHAEMEAYVLE